MPRLEVSTALTKWVDSWTLPRNDRSPRRRLPYSDRICRHPCSSRHEVGQTRALKAQTESPPPHLPKEGAGEQSDRLAAKSRMAARLLAWLRAQLLALRACRQELK